MSKSRVLAVAALLCATPPALAAAPLADAPAVVPVAAGIGVGGLHRQGGPGDDPRRYYYWHKNAQVPYFRYYFHYYDAPRRLHYREQGRLRGGEW